MLNRKKNIVSCKNSVKNLNWRIKMIKYYGKNKDNLHKCICEMVGSRSYDVIIRNNLTENALHGVAIDEEIIKKIQKGLDYGKTEKDREEFAMQTAVHFLSLGEEGSEVEFGTHFLGCVKREDVAEFMNNPYIKNIKIDESMQSCKNNIEFKINSYDKFEVFQSNSCSRRKDFLVKPRIGYFNEKVYYPSIYENGDVWMSITPSEINTMKHHIAAMKGKVLVFGLGLGYFAYMSALKDNVESVTVVELNQDIVDIFNTHIYTQIDENIKSKIKVIKGDAKELFLNIDFMSGFNTCFIDIWKNSEDGIPAYSYFKENEKLHKLKPCYWIEEDIELQYQDAMCSYIVHLFCRGFHDLDSQRDNINMLRENLLIRKIENYFNDTKYMVRDKGDIQKLIFDKNLMKKIMSKPIKD
jgi:hypothetical protein